MSNNEFIYIKDEEERQKRKDVLLNFFKLGMLNTISPDIVEEEIMKSMNLSFSENERLKSDEKFARISGIEAAKKCLDKHKKLIDYPYN